MAGKPKRKIINYSVKPRMQARLFFTVLLIALISAGLMAAIFYFYSYREIGTYRLFHVHATNFLDYLGPIIYFSFGAALVVAVGFTLFFPLKIAGPLHRIEKGIKEQVSRGDLSVRFELRKGDELLELAEILNYCLDKLKVRIEKIKTSADELNSLVTVKRDKVDDEVVELVKKLGESLQEIKL